MVATSTTSAAVDDSRYNQGKASLAKINEDIKIKMKSKYLPYNWVSSILDALISIFNKTLPEVKVFL